MTIRISRLTNVSDTLVGVSDTIVFNNAKNTRVPNPFITKVRVIDSAAVADNQAPEQDTGDQQHQGKIEDLYEITGFISDRAADSTYITRMKQWDDEPKVNANWKEGRFGIVLDDFTQYNLTPVNTGSSRIGLMWLDLTWEIDWHRHPPEARFILRFKISRSDGT